MTTELIPQQPLVAYVNSEATTGTRNGKSLETPVTNFTDFQALSSEDFPVPTFTAPNGLPHIILRTDSSKYLGNITLSAIEKTDTFTEIYAPYATFHNIVCRSRTTNNNMDPSYPYNITVGYVKGGVHITRGTKFTVLNAMGITAAGADHGSGTPDTTILFLDGAPYKPSMNYLPNVYDIYINEFNGTINFSDVPTGSKVNIVINHWVNVAIYPTTAAEANTNNLITSLASIASDRNIRITGMINGRRFPPKDPIFRLRANRPDRSFYTATNSGAPTPRETSDNVPIWDIPVDWRVVSDDSITGALTFFGVTDDNGSGNFVNIDIRTFSVQTKTYGDDSKLRIAFSSFYLQVIGTAYGHASLNGEKNAAAAYSYNRIYDRGRYNKGYWTPFFQIIREQAAGV